MPRPRRRKGETFKERVARLIRHYVHEGYPHKQAIAIAYSVAERERRKKKKKKKKKGKK